MSAQCWTDDDGVVHTTPSNLVANRIYIKKGQAYQFLDRPFMATIFDDPYNVIGLKTARQVSKSTTLASDSIVYCETQAPYTDLIITPSQDQTRKFSHDRLGPTIETSPAVRAQVSSENLANVFEREFYNGSKIYLSYAKDNADRTRGITADGVKFDEVQDMILKTVEPVVSESMFTSRYQRKMYSGTPKSMSNGIEQRIWRQSDQREWMVRCRHHDPSMPFHQKLNLDNVGKKGPICKRCGHGLNTLDGLWVRTATRTEQGREPKIHGYHIPQIIFPTRDVEVAPGYFGFLNWEQFLIDLEKEDEATILNEKFGESADSEERPIKEDELRALCDENMRMPSIYQERMIGTHTFAGVDWGFGLKSATVLAIGQFSPKNKKLFDYVYLKKYEKKEADPGYCVPDMIRIMRDFRVHRCHADWGGGFGLNSQLRDALGEDFVTTNFWGPIKSKQIKFNVDLNAFMLNRTSHLARFFQALKRRQMRMRMSWSEFRSFADDILHVFREERKDGTMYFDHKPEEPDDAMHAMCYAWIIASLHRYGFECVERVRGQEHFPYRA